MLYRYYSASIEAITENGEVHVIFDAYKNRDTTRLEDLKEVSKDASKDERSAMKYDLNSFLFFFLHLK